MDLAQSAVHEVYAVAQAVMWAAFGYIAARAFDHIGGVILVHLRSEESDPIEAE